MNPSFLLILLVLIVPVAFFMYKKKKKNEAEAPRAANNKKTSENGETWRVIKKYLKDKGEIGQEIIEIFATKKQDPNDKSLMTKEQKKEYKIKQKQKKQLKKTNPEQYKLNRQKQKEEKKLKQPEDWFLIFATRNTKTNKITQDRLIKVTIKHEKINKKSTERRFYVTDKLNYKKEMEWIAPLKQKEDIQIQKQKKMDDKKQQRLLKKQDPERKVNQLKAKYIQPLKKSFSKKNITKDNQNNKNGSSPKKQNLEQDQNLSKTKVKQSKPTKTQKGK